MCVDEATFRIGYFKKNSVLPLLLTCRQLHSEASRVLYAENVFVFHISSLAERPLAFFELPLYYLMNVRRAYIRTEVLLSPPASPGGRSSTFHAFTGFANEMESPETLYHGRVLSEAEIEQSGMLVEHAIPVGSGFLVDHDNTIDRPAESWIWRSQRDHRQLYVDDWWSSSCCFWKLVVESHATGIYQVFRRVNWTKETTKKDPTALSDALIVGEEHLMP
ncbi:MAG: hypothetical protein Q9169_008267 [Polycauliona sp. 2 TL-2023]